MLINVVRIQLCRMDFFNVVRTQLLRTNFFNGVQGNVVRFTPLPSFYKAIASQNRFYHRCANQRCTRHCLTKHSLSASYNVVNILQGTAYCIYEGILLYTSRKDMVKSFWLTQGLNRRPSSWQQATLPSDLSSNFQFSLKQFLICFLNE